MKKYIYFVFLSFILIGCDDGLTYIPDDGFERILIAKGYDDVEDDYVVRNNINTIESISLFSGGDPRFYINDLTGLQEFAALKELKFNDQFATAYDFSQNPNLESLEFYQRGIKKIESTSLKHLKYSRAPIDTLDLRNCPNLESFEYSEAGTNQVDLSLNTALKELKFARGDIPEIDLSNNTLLEYIEINGSLTEIDLSNNLLVKELILESNFLTSLDLSLNTALTYVDVNYNHLGALNIKNGNNTNITFFKAITNPGLNCIQVDNPTYSTANWTQIDSHSSFNLDCSSLNQTYVPDNGFETLLINYGFDDVMDDYVKTINIESAEIINLSSGGHSRFQLSDLTGLEDFVALKELRMGDQFATSYDYNQNPNLETLYFADRAIQKIESSSLKTLIMHRVSMDTLDIKGCPAIEKLDFSNVVMENLDLTNNRGLKIFKYLPGNIPDIDLTQNVQLEVLELDGSLTSIDLSQNLLLEKLDLESNLLTTLNVSLNEKLSYLNVNYNRLTSLNVKNGFNTDFTYFKADQNPGLSCIQVDNAAWSTTNWTLIDATATFSEDCGY